MRTLLASANGTPSALRPGGARVARDRESPDLPRRGRFETPPSRLSITLRVVAALVLVAVSAEEAAAQCTLPAPLGHTPPGPVTGTVRVEARVESLRVSWNAVTGANRRYVVQWKSGSEGYDSARGATVSGTSHTIGGLTPGIEHTVRVFAATRVNLATQEETPVWATVCSTASSREVTRRPLAPPVAPPPMLDQVTGVRVGARVESLRVSWNAVTGAGGYVVQWKSGSQGYGAADRQAATTVTASDPGTSHSITGLRPGTEYTVRVIATGSGVADGDPSRGVPGTPRAAPPPMLDQVTGVRVEARVESLRVSWNRVSGAGGYVVQWKSGSQGYGAADRQAATTVTASDPGTSRTITGLEPDTEYTLRVIATRSGADDGPPSDDASVRTLPVPPPGQVPGVDQVTGVRVEARVESLRVSWNAVSGAGGYVVQWKSGSQGYGAADRQAATTVTASDPGTSRTITGLEPDTEYTLRVIATRSGADDGPPSDEVTRATLRRLLVSIAREASVVEGAAAELSVQLSESSSATVTVAWTTVEGSAKAGEDYRAERAGLLTFEPGERMGTLRVPTLEDRRGEPLETFEVRLTEAPNAALDPRADSATVTITDDDDTEAARGRALGRVLAAAGRWFAADAVHVVGERFTAPAAGARSGPGAPALVPAESGSWTAAGPGSGVHRAGRREGGERRSVAELLARSGFDVPLGTAGDAAGAGDASAGWRLWARGTTGGFDEGPEAGFRLGGEVARGYLGLDRRLEGGALAGVAIALDRSDVAYAIDSVTTGSVDLEMTSVLPYAHFRPRPGLGAWGLLGAGWGRAELKDEAGKVKTDVKMRMVAAGLRQEVAAWRGIDAAAKVDGFLTELETDAAAGLPETTGDASQLRLGLEGRWQVETSPAARMTPSLEIGGRWDGGDAGKGVGVEVGGGLAYSDVALGLEVGARGWFLLAHQEKAFEEWGGSLTVKLDPGQAGRGPWVTFAPGWRAAGSRGLQAWKSPEAFRTGGGSGETPDLSPDRLDLEVGYGAPAHGGLLTPYAGVSMAGAGTRHYRLGARLDLDGRADLGVEGRRSARAGGADTNEIVIRVRVVW